MAPNADFDQCICWVSKADEETRYTAHRGAHEFECPVYAPSRDPVDAAHDKDLKAWGLKEYATPILNAASAYGLEIFASVSGSNYHTDDCLVWDSFLALSPDDDKVAISYDDVGHRTLSPHNCVADALRHIEVLSARKVRDRIAVHE